VWGSRSAFIENQYTLAFFGYILALETLVPFYSEDLALGLLATKRRYGKREGRLSSIALVSVSRLDSLEVNHVSDHKSVATKYGSMCRKCNHCFPCVLESANSTSKRHGGLRTSDLSKRVGSWR
jgi:hypothetical protein